MQKIAVFDGDGLMALHQHQYSEPSRIDELIEQFRPDKGVLSSVIGKDKKMIKALKAKLSSFLWFDKNTKIPISIEYETISTLGNDRIAAVVGANLLHPAKNLLVIDAGTAITFELLEASGVYKGGNISLGLTTRFRALNFFTDNLPLVKELKVVPLIGTTTESAIQAGVINGMVYEIDGVIDALKAKYDEIYVFLTGGHATYFADRLKNRTFVDRNLVLTGLNRILEYNAKTM